MEMKKTKKLKSKDTEKKRTTFYAEKELLKKAKMYCVKNDTDITNIINEFFKTL